MTSPDPTTPEGREEIRRMHAEAERDVAAAKRSYEDRGGSTILVASDVRWTSLARTALPAAIAEIERLATSNGEMSSRIERLLERIEDLESDLVAARKDYQ